MAATSRNRAIQRLTQDDRVTMDDRVVIEEPMEIRVIPGPGERHSLAVTMRTPGHDEELAAGFLYSEGAVTGAADITRILPCAPDVPGGENVINVHLAPGTPFDAARFSRNVYTTSSCGVCGKTSLDMVKVACPAVPRGGFARPASFWTGLPLGLEQPLFAATGGLHAAALFASDGRLRLTREDVGRHNAVDKILGRLLLDGDLPASDSVLLLSGRAGYELVQKAAMAGIPAVAALGAPSSLAVELAEDMGMTLIGFLKTDGFNVYCGAERVS